MKKINLFSLVNLYTNLKHEIKNELFINFINHHGIKEAKDICLSTLKSLLAFLSEKYYENIWNDFYFSYQIAQINKEFDLLRFGENYIINIELKSKSCEDKIKKQLIKNKYYLEVLDKTIYYFSYIEDKNKIYQLVEDKLQEVKKEVLFDILKNQIVEDIGDINTYFKPSKYLISPFNNTDGFLDNKYFLTQEQNEVKDKILKIIEAKNKNFICISGNAGTGKTLLTFDIARNFKETIVISCTILNDGHNKLNQSSCFNIKHIKEYSSIPYEKFKIIVIDEAQRLRTEQLEFIIVETKKLDIVCMFSYDHKQVLSSYEENANIAARIKKIDAIEIFELNNKIRTNKEISDFIRRLFDKSKNEKDIEINKKDIEINYFLSEKNAKIFLEELENKKWKTIYFTPSSLNNEYHETYITNLESTSHKVIGQEFDNVAIVIDKKFEYDNDGNLIYNDEIYYCGRLMLYQNITRVRNRLNIVIINNQNLLKRCLEILK